MKLLKLAYMRNSFHISGGKFVSALGPTQHSLIICRFVFIDFFPFDCLFTIPWNGIGDGATVSDIADDDDDDVDDDDFDDKN